MKQYKLADGSIVSADELQKRKAEDFKFMTLCQAKSNNAMYRMLRDTSLDTVQELS
jgi:hypothetical protein